MLTGIQWVCVIGAGLSGGLLVLLLYSILEHVAKWSSRRTMKRQWEDWKGWYPEEYKWMKLNCGKDPDEIVEGVIREVV